MKTRLFLGIPVSDHHKRLVTKSVLPLQTLYPDFRWIHPNNYHITVSFFGLLEEEKVTELQEAISDVAKNCTAFTLKSERFAWAPPKKLPRMLWELFQESEEFNELIRQTEEKVGSLIILPDYRKSHAPLPHITLARFAPTEMADSLPEMHDAFRIEKIVLFESKLQSTGSEYRTLAEINLQ